jgi:hypothetical protein
MRIIGRDAPVVKLYLNFKAAVIRKRLRYSPVFFYLEYHTHLL